MPLQALQRDCWVNLAFNVAALVGGCFGGQPFRSLDLMILGGSFKVRHTRRPSRPRLCLRENQSAGRPLSCSLLTSLQLRRVFTLKQPPPDTVTQRPVSHPLNRLAHLNAPPCLSACCLWPSQRQVPSEPPPPR